MNTLRDTHQGRTRPSVWPVYVAAVVVLVGAVPLLIHSVQLPEIVSDLRRALSPFGPSVKWVVMAWGPELVKVAVGLVGVLTAVGLVLLHRWGWWCAIAWVAVFAFLSATDGLVIVRYGMEHAPEGAISANLIMLLYVLVGVAVMVLVMGPLATRRRLFFPPKQEGEE